MRTLLAEECKDALCRKSLFLKATAIIREFVNDFDTSLNFF